MVFRLMNEEDELIVVNCGAFRFSYQKTANIITTEKEKNKEIVNQLLDDKSELKRLYNIGIDKSDYKIMDKLFSLANTGDMQALKEYDKRVIKNKMKNS